MIRLSTGSTRTDTLFPFTTLLRTSRCRSQLRSEDETHGPSGALRGQSGTIRARTVAGASGQTVPARASCIAPAAMERRTNMALDRDQLERIAKEKVADGRTWAKRGTIAERGGRKKGRSDDLRAEEQKAEHQQQKGIAYEV